MERLKHALEWNMKHPEIAARLAEEARLHRNKKNREYMKSRQRIDSEFKLLLTLRGRVGAAFRGQGLRKHARTKDLIGCTVAEAKQYLQALFRPGMSWENHGKWHIDHIRPCTSFDLTNLEERRQCFHYTNLQPLWSLENHRKGGTWMDHRTGGQRGEED